MDKNLDQVVDQLFEDIENAFSAGDTEEVNTILCALLLSEEVRVNVNALRASSRAKAKLSYWLPLLNYTESLIPEAERKRKLRGLKEFK
jgi:hypothetical protein